MGCTICPCASPRHPWMTTMVQGVTCLGFGSLGLLQGDVLEVYPSISEQQSRQSSGRWYPIVDQLVLWHLQSEDQYIIRIMITKRHGRERQITLQMRHAFSRFSRFTVLMHQHAPTNAKKDLKIHRKVRKATSAYAASINNLLSPFSHAVNETDTEGGFK